MISLEEIHLHTLIHKLGKSCKDSDITLWHDIAVLVPEVPDITQKVKGFRALCRYPAKKRHKTSLTGCRIGNPKS